MPEHRTAQPKVQGRWIDGHCHLADPRLATQLEASLAAARTAGIGAWIQGGVDPEDWDRQLQLRAKLGSAIVCAFGLHPWWVAAQDESVVEVALETLAARLPEASALGELGLDLHPRHCPPETLPKQSWVFEHQLELGKSAAKPLILHIVSAHAEALEILARYWPFPAGGLVHSFGASEEIAKRYLDLGFHLSLGGSVTREGFQKLKKAVGSVPLDRLVVETDAPDQTPVLAGVAKGDLNEPRNLVGIAEAVAKMRAMSAQAVLDQSTENLKRLFAL